MKKVTAVEDLKTWNFDGSSTGTAAFLPNLVNKT
jgi:hypothetical protein